MSIFSLLYFNKTWGENINYALRMHHCHFPIFFCLTYLFGWFLGDGYDLKLKMPAEF